MICVCVEKYRNQDMCGSYVGLCLFQNRIWVYGFSSFYVETIFFSSLLLSSSKLSFAHLLFLFLKTFHRAVELLFFFPPISRFLSMALRVMHLSATRALEKDDLFSPAFVNSTLLCKRHLAIDFLTISILGVRFETWRPYVSSVCVYDSCIFQN